MTGSQAGLNAAAAPPGGGVLGGLPEVLAGPVGPGALDRELRTVESPCAWARHPRQLHADAAQIEWLPAGMVPQQMRVYDFTCGRCREMSYEVGTVGGAYVIRRTDHKRRQVVETAPLLRRVALALWEALVNGWAI